MDAHTIDLLAAHDPASRISRMTTGVMTTTQSPLLSQGLARFLARYQKPNFGWYIACQFANNGIRFPVALHLRDSWVIKAYCMLVDPDRFRDDTIIEAFHISQRSHGVNIGDIMMKTHILSMSHDGDSVEEQIKSIANSIGCSPDLVEAYECLFYNVLDRRRDNIYMTHEVYPETRFVEMSDNYFQNATLLDLIKRSGFNHRDLDLSAYLLGIGDQSYLAKLASRPDRESELTKYMMGNGLMLTRANMLNQRSVGMTRAASLLAASRQGGTQSEVPAMEGLASNLAEELHLAMAESQEATAALMRQDAAGALIEV